MPIVADKGLIHIVRLSESLLKLKLRDCKLKPLAVICIADALPESKLELLDLSVNEVGAKALPRRTLQDLPHLA